jgi:hypothetical protein
MSGKVTEDITRVRFRIGSSISLTYVIAVGVLHTLKDVAIKFSHDAGLLLRRYAINGLRTSKK